MNTQQIIDKETGQVFTVEQVGECEFQSVFPERLADHSAIHTTEGDAWGWIDEVIAGERQANSQFGVGA